MRDRRPGEETSLMIIVVVVAGVLALCGVGAVVTLIVLFGVNPFGFP
jgi:preprotein translocase subunit Sss1